MRSTLDVWTFRHLTAYLLKDLRRGAYSYDSAFRRYERSAGLNPALRRIAYSAGKDFISRYYTLTHVAETVYGNRGPRALADLWIHYFGAGLMDDDERKRYSKKIARDAPRGKLPDLDEVLDELDDVARIAVELSYPRWLVAELRAAMGDEVARMLASLNEEHRWLRVNLTATDVDTAMDALMAEGASVRKHEKLEYMLRVTNYAGSLSRLKAVVAGYVTPQDLGSAIIAEEMEDCGGVVLDACSAPGEKAAVMLMRRSNLLVGCDISLSKLRGEAALLRRWRMPEYRASLAVCDAMRLPRGRFGQSIIDAPCTDSGDVGRNPAVKLMLENRGVVERFTRIQRALLRSVIRSTRRLVVYSTRSILPEEGERIVRGTEQMDSRTGLPGGYWGIGHRVYPHLHDSGGFFVARLAPGSTDETA